MRFLRYGIAATVAVILAATLFVAGCGGEKSAASVNGVGIPVSKIDAKLKQLEKANASIFQGKDAEKTKQEYRGKVVEYYIIEQLIRQEAEKQKLSVTDKEVDARYEEIRKSTNKNVKDFEALLQQQGVTPAEFKSDLKTQMIAQKIYPKVTTKSKVTDAEIQTYYDKNKTTEFVDREKVKAQQVLTEKEEDANKAKVELDGGADFAAVAKKYSIDTTNKDKGGELEPLSKDQVVAEWGTAVFGKNVGETTGIFKTSYGFHIVKVLEKTPEKQKTFEEVKDVIKQSELKKKQDTEWETWLKELRKKYEVKTF